MGPGHWYRSAVDHCKKQCGHVENQLQASEENVKAVQEQSNTAMVYSDVNGVADIVTVKVGETFRCARFRGN